MGKDCGCDHCDCDDEDGKKSDDDASTATPEEKVEKLKKAIKELGFQVEDTKDGIKISQP